MHDAKRLLLLADRQFARDVTEDLRPLQLELERVDTPGSLVAALRRQAWHIALCQADLPHLRLEVALALTREFGGEIEVVVAGEGESVGAMPGALLRCAPGEAAEIVERLLRREERRDAHRGARALLPEERCLEVLDRVPWVVYAHDPQGRFTYVNRTAERIGGYAPGELLGRDFGDVVALDQLEIARRGRTDTGGDEAMVYEIDLLARDGRRVRVEVMSWLILRDGKPQGTYGTARFLEPAVAALAAALPDRDGADGSERLGAASADSSSRS